MTPIASPKTDERLPPTLSSTSCPPLSHKGIPVKSLLLIVSLTVAWLAAGRAANAEPPDAAGIEFYEKSIRPVLVRSCYKCHSSQSKTPKGGLRLDGREWLLRGGDNGPAVVPGKVDASLLVTALRYSNDDLQMPPKGKLPDKVIADFERWVKLGGPAPNSKATIAAKSDINIEQGRKFWSFQLPHKSAVPSVNDAAWPKSNIDAFVLARLEQEGLKPVGDATRVVLIRRTYFDLIGLPPTPADIDRFVNDSSPQAFESLVDRLLESPRFGERWGRHWLDVARYAESTGRSVNFLLSHAWRYRDYVIDSFNADKPYDQFIREQIAGDLLPADSDKQANEQRIATGFLAVGPRELDYDDREQRGTDAYFLHSINEQIDVTCRGILAMTVSCAQCHDHKFDPIPTRDYYALAGIFGSSKAQVGYAHGLGNSGRFYPANFVRLRGFSESDDQAWNAYVKSGTTAWDTLKANMTELWLIRRQEGQPGFTDKKREKQEKIVKDFRAKLVALAKKMPAKQPVAIGVVDLPKPSDMHVCIAGDVETPGPLAQRGFLQVVGDGSSAKIPADQSGRLQLADWLTSKTNPLTARVMVNRIWHHLFGRGLVPTVDNFGSNGERPSHPQLLDNLAIEFMEQGWSVKRMIRKIMLSRVYQLASNHDAGNFAVDPDNHLLWRMNRRRLEVEAFRDAMLSVSGQLKLNRPAGSPLMKTGAIQITSSKGIPATAATARGVHRTVYQTIIRDMEPPMFRAFDFPSTSGVHGRRDTTTVATQALFLMNNPFVIDQSRQAATRVLANKKLENPARVELAFRLAYGRLPSPLERQRVLDYLTSTSSANNNKSQSDAWATFFQSLFASAEFGYLE